MGVRSDEIEADFQRYYRVALGDLFTGELSVRRFSVLLLGLPPGCATWRAQGGSLAWSDEATAIFAVENAVHNFQASFGKNPKPVPPREPPEWGHLEKEASKLATTQRRLDRHLRRTART